MKMKKLASIINFASPEKGNKGQQGYWLQSRVKEKSVKGASDRDKGVSAQSRVKEKSVQVASDRDKGVSAQSMIEAKQEIGINVDGEKSGFPKNNFLVKNTKKCSRPISASTEKAGFTNIANMRRFRSPTESIPAKSAERVPIKPGQHHSTQPEERVPTKPGHQNSTQSGQITQTDQLKICAQFQSQQHSPVQSSQRTSHSRQSTPIQSQESRQFTPRSQSRQGTPNVSSSAANNYIYWNIGSTDNNGRTRVEVIKKVLEPSHECSSKIRQIMYEKLEPTGYNWKSISKETRDFYFEEFKKYFVWRQSDAVIYQGWLASARRKYSELCSVAHSAWEKREQPDKRISMDVYSSWTVFWETPKFQKKSEIQKNNRSSGVDGNLSTHTSGSASHRTIAARAQMKYQCDPTADQIFLITHLKNPNIKKITCGENDEDEENGENCNDKTLRAEKMQEIQKAFGTMGTNLVVGCIGDDLLPSP